MRTLALQRRWIVCLLLPSVFIFHTLGGNKSHYSIKALKIEKMIENGRLGRAKMKNKL